jgi:putative glutamine amidotransferase
MAPRATGQDGGRMSLSPMPPLIVVSVPLDDRVGRYWSLTFARPLAAAGAVAVLLSDYPSERERRALLHHADGLLLSGGADIDPRLYGEALSGRLGERDDPRDAVELPLVREAVELGLPLVGTCRGMQAIAVALGGTLWLDAADHPGAEAHPSGGIEGFDRCVEAELAGLPAPADLVAHPIATTPGSALRAAFGERASVNSFHHQHVRDLPAGLRPTATAPDGVVEGIEGDGLPGLVLGVQWELQIGAAVDPGQRTVFALLANEARARRAGRERELV